MSSGRFLHHPSPPTTLAPSPSYPLSPPPSPTPPSCPESLSASKLGETSERTLRKKKREIYAHEQEKKREIYAHEQEKQRENKRTLLMNTANMTPFEGSSGVLVDVPGHMKGRSPAQPCAPRQLKFPKIDKFDRRGGGGGTMARMEREMSWRKGGGDGGDCGMVAWGVGVLWGHARRASGSTRGRMLWFIQPRSGGDVDKVCFALSSRLNVIYSSAGRHLCPRGSL
ncbi:unnamed protein product [Pleuronectes platessa]|uniref:Uncharacterized protein n=1 Tax=Pleuronectes platessa TaxID=8262 RepID=A0A9N7UN45_PLEPL|nr:unnamed protein product [Pleuronectes platessa]